MMVKTDEEKLSTGRRKELVGIVLSDKMNKTRVVEVTRLVRHGLYGKTVKVKQRFKCHDERNESKSGDKIRIMETRPLSKDKRWRLVEILTKAQTVTE